MCWGFDASSSLTLSSHHLPPSQIVGPPIAELPLWYQRVSAMAGRLLLSFSFSSSDMPQLYSIHWASLLLIRRDPLFVSQSSSIVSSLIL